MVQAWNLRSTMRKRPLTVVAAAEDASSESTTYLIASAAAVALLGTALPILFSRKECDGAGFVRKARATLRANAAKDWSQIVSELQRPWQAQPS